MALALRATAACPGPDPGAFAFAILQTQSGSARGKRGQPRNDDVSLISRGASARLGERQLDVDAGGVGQEQLDLVKFVHGIGCIIDAGGVEPRTGRFEVIAVEGEMIENTAGLPA